MTDAEHKEILEKVESYIDSCKVYPSTLSIAAATGFSVGECRAAQNIINLHRGVEGKRSCKYTRWPMS